MTVGQDRSLFGGLLHLHFVKNPGAAFSFATGQTWIFSLVAAAVVAAIVVLIRRIQSTRWALMLGMLLGGTCGNLTDRLLREPGFGVGHVVDFIYLPWILPAIFNIADTFIVSSMGLLLLLTLLGVGLDGRRASKRPTTADADGAVAQAQAAEDRALEVEAIEADLADDRAVSQPTEPAADRPTESPS